MRARGEREGEEWEKGVKDELKKSGREGKRKEKKGERESWRGLEKKMEIGNRKWRKERVGKRKEEKGGKLVEKRREEE